MKHVKRHKIKKEKPETSSLHLREQEDHDLAYYIHDRVELMHQVFSVLKYKELKAMAPECARNLAIGDLEELCTEELLGISSKRLLAILDGAEPPSDTESSSSSPPSEQMETISLDSISSDEEILAASGSKKKHKHRRHSKSKSKAKKKDKPQEPAAEENAELSKASRAGLTVLELLELQARARAIRAQLQQEQVNKRPSETAAVESSHHSSDNEVEIKEETPDVVEISSEDEKPNIHKLQEKIAQKPPSPKPEPQSSQQQTSKHKDTQESTQTVTKRINDLIVTVPAQSTRKIKLNRSKVTVSIPNTQKTRDSDVVNTERSVTIAEKTLSVVVDNEKKKGPEKVNKPAEKTKDKGKKKKKDKKKKKEEKDGSDHDEITLQLSDTEKMDLLEDLDESRPNYDRVTSSSEDSESSSSEDDDEEVNSSIETKDCIATEPSENLKESVSSPKLAEKDSQQNITDSVEIDLSEIDISDPQKITNDIEIRHGKNKNTLNNELEIERTNSKETKDDERSSKYDGNSEIAENDLEDPNNVSELVENSQNQSESLEQNSSETNVHTECFTQENTSQKSPSTISDEPASVVILEKNLEKESNLTTNESPENTDKITEIAINEDIPVVTDDTIMTTNEESQETSKNNKHSNNSEKGLSDGELSDRESSEVEAMDIQPIVVCISDDENTKSNKKKKKKDKKSKKEKKTKKSKSDFRNGADQNFYKDENDILDDIIGDRNRELNIVPPSNEKGMVDPDTVDKNKVQSPIELDTDDDVYEILELSDDSSCYEVEGTVLSKEPTAEEIEALSAKIDEIEREEVVTDEQIRQHEMDLARKERNEGDNIENLMGNDRSNDTNTENQTCPENESDNTNIENTTSPENPRYSDTNIKNLNTSIDENDQSDDNIEHISWKDRYLGSNKVKRVLTTSNILNALRKKNKELKKKIKESKKKEQEEKVEQEDEKIPEKLQPLEEGSIDQYNALEGSTKYVDPIKESTQENGEQITEKKEDIVALKTEGALTKEMKKDAKQLLKMYKKLLKYNDMNKQKDPSKKKKKKTKKKEKNGSSNVPMAVAENVV